MPKTDWGVEHFGVWLATAVPKGQEIEIKVSVPMWRPKPELKGKDPQGAEDFVVSELKATLKPSDLKVYRKNGTLVEAKEYSKLLAKETAVFWASFEKPRPLRFRLSPDYDGKVEWT